MLVRIVLARGPARKAANTDRFSDKDVKVVGNASYKCTCTCERISLISLTSLGEQREGDSGFDD